MVRGDLESALFDRRGRRVGAEISFVCPFHADTNPSCSWNPDKRVYHCHGCGASGGENKLREALGLPTVPSDCEPPPGWPPGVPTALKGAQVVLYAYRGLDGEVIGYVARSDPPPPVDKIIYPYFGRENGKWKAAAAKRPRPLYGMHRLGIKAAEGLGRSDYGLHRLPKAAEGLGRSESKYPDEPIFVVEGEKCVDALARVKVVAVTSPGGSSAWRAADWSPLAGRRVIIWPDNDGPGVDYMHGVAGVLAELGCEVSAIDPSTLGLSPRGDAADWISGGKRSKEDALSIPTVDPSTIKKPKSEKKTTDEKKKKAKAPPAPPPSITGLRELTDLGNAERLRDQHGEDLRYATGLGWLHWDGQRWERDPDALVVRELAAATARGIRQEAMTCSDPEKFAVVAKHAARSEQSSRIRAMVDLLAPMVRVDHAAFDADPWVINTPTGIVDVRTGELRPHDRAAFCTMITRAGYDPAADAERWRLFTGEVLPDPEVLDFIQRFFGSCLSGIALDRAMVLTTGTGHNGKGVMIETIAHVLGDYSHAVTQRFVARRASDPVPPHELAQLPGKRMVYGAELSDSTPMDVEMLKSLTGSDTIQACHKYQAPFSFKPQCKIIVSSNHRPPIHDQTASIWDRLRIVKFPNSFERGKNRDERLGEKLKLEGPGILRWMLEGALAWQRDGLGSALSVDVETDNERRSQDPLDDFFMDIAMIHPEGRVTNSDLYGAYKEWAEREGIKRPWTKSGLTRALQQRPGVGHKRSAKERVWVGIALRDTKGEARKQDLVNQGVIAFDTAKAAEGLRRSDDRTEPRGGDDDY